jgi:hypothetical protein
MSEALKAEAQIAAANIIAETQTAMPVDSYELLVSLVALGWLNGWRAGAVATRDIAISVIEGAA